MKIGFALVVENEYLNKIVKNENSIHNKAGFFNFLGTIKNLPHTTLFQGEILDEFDYKEMAMKIASKFEEGNKKLVFGKVVYVEEGWYFYECEKTEFLQKLHNFVLSEVEKFIVLDDSRLERNIQGLPQNQIDGIVKYGYRYSDSAFYPHITIGRNVEKNAELLNELNEMFCQLGNEALIDRVTVYLMGENGTHSETLFEVKL